MHQSTSSAKRFELPNGKYLHYSYLTIRTHNIIIQLNAYVRIIRVDGGNFNTYCENKLMSMK